jgi:hypothetical protein
MRKRLRFLIPAILLLVWLWQGTSMLKILDPARSANRDLERAEAELRKLNPEADAFLAKVQDARDRTALGASLRAAEMEYGADSALRSYAKGFGQEGGPAYYRLLRLAADVGMAPSEADREAVLYAHGTTVQHLMLEESGRSADDYLRQLESAAEDQSLWPIVRDDPVALLLWPQLKDDEALWQFYRDERDWLGEVLAAAAPTSDPDALAVDPGAFFADLVGTACRFHPMVKQAVVEDGFGIVALPLFDAYGEVLRETSRLGVPVGEALEIVFANQDQFAVADTQAAAALADRLVHLKKNKPLVWEMARREPLVLRLDAAVPNLSEPLLKKFAGNDVAGFLFTGYEDAIMPAAAALDRFGDLGFYILNRYQDDPRAHALLADPEIGVRMVPFLAQFQDRGFEKLDDDKKWLDRYFDAEGNAKDQGWIDAIPIAGAPVNVMSHWMKGEPVSWGELGWAAVDVADGMLLVASFGASAPVTAAKQTAKTGGRAIVKATVREGAREAATKSVAKVATRVVARDSMLKTFVRRGGVWAVELAGGTKAVLKVGRVTVGKVGATMRDAARRLGTTWASTPARFRKWAYRGMLAVGLYVTLKERTIPGLPAAAAAMGAFAGEFARSAAEAAGTFLANALRETLDISSSPMARAVYLGTAVVLAILAVWMFFYSKPGRLKRIA